MIVPMKPVLWIPVSCALALSLSNCGNSGADPYANTGPFDRNGNYVEEWADNPRKWRKSGGASPHDRGSDEIPEIVLNTDQPPLNSTPLPPSNVSKPTPIRTTSRVEPQPRITTTVKPTPTVARNTATKPKPKPKPVVAKAKPKPKPKPKPAATRYIVKKGDSLSAIAARNGSSVSAIQRANGISGSMIRPGQSLSIPKR